jgi:hypothetical protein
VSLYVARKARHYLISAGGSTPDPIPRDRTNRLVVDPLTRRFVYPEGRWNTETVDTLYTSHRPETARAEAEHHAARRLPTIARIGWVAATNAAYLGDSGSRTEAYVILEFDDLDIDPARVWDVRALPDLESAFEPLLIPWAWAPPQAIGAAHRAAGRACLIVPACPPWVRTPRSIEWNSAFYVGNGGVDPDTLPGWSSARLYDEFETTVPY